MANSVRVKDIAILNMGQSPKSKFYTNNKNDIPFLQGNRTFGNKYPKIDSYCNKPTKIAKKGNVLMSVRAPVGDLNMAPCDLCIGRGIAELESITNEPEYLYYVLLANKFRLDKGGNGTIFNSIGKDELNNMILKVPNDSEKDYFVDTLKTIDDKIENNYKTSMLISEYLQLLFYKWFVQFNFPNEYGEEYRNNNGKFKEVKGKYIPLSWELKSLSEFTNRITETINPQENQKKLFKHYSIPVYDDTKTYSEEFGEKILSNKYIVKSNNLLISKLNPWFKRIVYPIGICEAICSTEFVVWQPKKDNLLEYLYVVANSQRFTTYCINASTGTSNSHKRVNPEFMMKYEVPYDEEIIFKFNEMVKPMVKKINLLLVENNKLIETRNILVNKLIK